MSDRSFALFGKINVIEKNIDEFLDTLSEGAIVFKGAMGIYLGSGCESDLFQQKLKQISKLEHNGDVLRRSIESDLYTKALIPDSRGDVLSLMEDLDWLLNMFESCLYAFWVECPEFSAEQHADLTALTEQVCQCVEACVVASRAFFRNISAVRDHLHHVMVYEKEADRLAMHIKKAIFSSDLPLERKTHLRYFIDKVDSLADEAEDVADWLAIYTIKRGI